MSILLMAASMLLGACTTGGLQVDKTHRSENQDSRVLFLVLHATAGDFDSSLQALTVASNRPVSSHYLVRDDPVRIYQLVDEGQRAWHAGASVWRGHTPLNASSIGIEIVNPAPVKTAAGTTFAPFPAGQIDAVLALAKDIVARHGIRPEHVVAHSDIQPQSRQDPGPMFPWKRFADAGLIAWPDAAMVAERTVFYSAQLPGVDWFQRLLAEHGFGVPRSGELDALTRSVISAFQMKYRPARFDGTPDAETAALLEVVQRADGMTLRRPPPLEQMPAPGR